MNLNPFTWLAATATGGAKSVRSEPQTNDLPLSLLHSEFAGHTSRGLTPKTLAAALDAAERGRLIEQNDIAIDMEEKDAHLSAELYKRRMAVAQLDWSVAPPRNPSARDRKRAQMMEEALRDLPFDLEDLVFDMSDAILHGFCCLEFDGWARGSGGLLRPNAAIHRPQSWFTVDEKTRSRILLRASSETEGELNEYGWIVHIHRTRSGYVTRMGLMRVLALPYLYKNYGVRDFAEYLEIHGIPPRIGRYPTGSKDTEKSTLLAALAGISHGYSGIMPQGMQVELLEAADGTSDPFMAMISWAERSESKAILGGTLTTEPGTVGSQSLGNVHKEVADEIRGHDARQQASSLTRYLLWPIAKVNGLVDDAGRMPRIVFDTGEAEDLKAYADSVPKLVSLGMDIPRSWLREKLRIPEPEGDEPLLQTNPGANHELPLPMPHPGEQSPQTEQVKRQAAASASVDDTDPSPVTEHTARIEEDAREAMSEIMDVVDQAISSGESLAALQDKLVGMYADLPQDKLVKVMTMAFACADLAGRVDVNEGR